MNAATVTRRRITELLKCTQLHVRRLRQGGMLPGWYGSECPVESLDAFLAASFKNTETAPRWADLESGQVVLLTYDEAMKQHGLQLEDLQRLRAQYKLPHLFLPIGKGSAPQWYRYPAAQLAGYIDGLSGETDVLNAWLAGYRDKAALNAAVARFGAAATDIQSRISTPSKLSEWRDECQAAKLRPLTCAEVAQRCGKTPEQAFLWLKRREVPYVRSLSNNLEAARFSPLWALSFNEKYRQSPRRDIVRLFDVTGHTVNLWDAGGRRVCPLGHDHAAMGSKWYAICWLAYLTANAPLAEAPRLYTFWSTRMLGGVATPLLGCAQVAALRGVSRVHIQRAAMAGAVPCVRTPGGMFRFAPEWI